MAEKQTRFRKIDVTRAIEAATAGGLQIGKIEIEPAGKIVIIAVNAGPNPQSDLDAWMNRHARSA